MSNQHGEEAGKAIQGTKNGNLTLTRLKARGYHSSVTSLTSLYIWSYGPGPDEDLADEDLGDAMRNGHL